MENILTRDDDILKRWKEHMENLYGSNRPGIDIYETENVNITTEDVMQALL